MLSFQVVFSFLAMATVGEFDDDELFLAALQSFEVQQLEATDDDEQTTPSTIRVPTGVATDSKRVTRSQSGQFNAPVSDSDLKEKVLRSVPQRTRQQTKWAVAIWMN